MQGEVAEYPEAIASGADRRRRMPFGVWLGLFLLFSAWITWRAKRLELSLVSVGSSTDIDGQRAPDFSLPTLDGRTVSLADYRGKEQVVVFFWASWCTPCQAEAPMLSDFYRQRHTPDSGFELLSISVDDDVAKAAAFRAQQKLPYPVLLDANGQVAGLYHAGGIPALYVVDREGKVVVASEGLNTALNIVLPMKLKLSGATPGLAIGGPPAVRH